MIFLNNNKRCSRRSSHIYRNVLLLYTTFLIIDDTAQREAKGWELALIGV
jgi:hypothetical protein